jgi:hypothetical protein
MAVCMCVHWVSLVIVLYFLNLRNRGLTKDWMDSPTMYTHFCFLPLKVQWLASYMLSCSPCFFFFLALLLRKKIRLITVPKIAPCTCTIVKGWCFNILGIAFFVALHKCYEVPNLACLNQSPTWEDIFLQGCS